jgi:hypothetical protein
MPDDVRFDSSSELGRTLLSFLCSVRYSVPRWLFLLASIMDCQLRRLSARALETGRVDRTQALYV